MAQGVLGCHIEEQLRCMNKSCSRITRHKEFCQNVFTISASGLREQAFRMQKNGGQASLQVRALQQAIYKSAMSVRGFSFHLWQATVVVASLRWVCNNARHIPGTANQSEHEPRLETSRRG